jgi:hypothetical protein
MRPSGDGDATARGDLSQDLDATVDFYTNLLGLIVTKDEGAGWRRTQIRPPTFYATKYIQAARFDSLTRNLSWRY